MADDLQLTPDEIRALKRFAQFLMGNGGAAASNGAASGGGRVATPGELRGQYGDPKVRKNPKRWAGASYIGATYSRCPSDYLEELAGYLDWCADKESQQANPKKHANGKNFYWEFDRKDAALARGWARANDGKAFPPPNQPSSHGDSGGADDDEPYTPPPTTGEDDDIPF